MLNKNEITPEEGANTAPNKTARQTCLLQREENRLMMNFNLPMNKW
jgi:hypothetical protein